MADDVKVKFGGDFSEIDKDAKSASNRIGTALGGWVDEYSKETKEKLKQTFSLSNIAEKFFDGVKEYLQKFEDLENMSKKLGVSTTELQQFGRLGKEMGVDMETLGKSIAFANKAIGGMKDNEKTRKLMTDLGFSTQEVTSSNIKSLDVLYKLADAYEETKKKSGEVIANNELAKHSSEIFGRAGYELNGIIKEGTSALKERIETMKIFSETEVKMAANANKMLKHAEEQIKNDVYGSIVTFYGRLAANTDLGGFTGSGGLMGKTYEKTGLEDMDEAMKSPESIKKFAKELSRQGKRKGYDNEMLIQMLTTRQDWGVGGTEQEANFYSQIQEQLREMIKNEIPSAITQESKPTNVGALAASSLQQIGGGDINSVMSGLANNDIADNTRRTAEATERIASQDQPNPTTQNLR
jgi:hypothetical protein